MVLLVIQEGSAPFSALPSVGFPLLLLNGAVAFGLNVAGVFLIGAAGSLVLTLSGILKVSSVMSDPARSMLTARM